MPPAVSALASRFSATDGIFRKTVLCAGVLAALHVAALAILIATETAPVPAAAFLLFWGLLNFAVLALLARPMIAAALSLGFLAVLILLSRFKHDVLLMTVNFVDLMVIDADTFTFLMKIFPQLGNKVAVAGALALVALVLMWCFDPFAGARGLSLSQVC